jgi:hypothetical protein
MTYERPQKETQETPQIRDWMTSTAPQRAPRGHISSCEFERKSDNRIHFYKSLSVH